MARQLVAEASTALEPYGVRGQRILQDIAVYLIARKS